MYIYMCVNQGVRVCLLLCVTRVRIKSVCLRIKGYMHIHVCESRVYVYRLVCESNVYVSYTSYVQRQIQSACLSAVVCHSCVNPEYMSVNLENMYIYACEPKSACLSVVAGWHRVIGCLMFICHFPQKIPIISGSFAKNDLLPKVSCVFATLYIWTVCASREYVCLAWHMRCCERQDCVSVVSLRVCAREYVTHHSAKSTTRLRTHMGWLQSVGSIRL